LVFAQSVYDHRRFKVNLDIEEKKEEKEEVEEIERE